MKTIESVGLSHGVLPSTLKNTVRSTLFSSLRKTRLTGVARKLGLPICAGHLQLTSTRGAAALQPYAGVQFKAFLEENPTATQPACFPVGQSLDAIAPLVAQTETCFLEITDRRFSLRNHHLLDPHLNVIEEVNVQFEKMPIRKKLLSKTTHVKGTVAYLSNTDIFNYYHWMCRTLPLLRIYQNTVGLDKIDFFYTGRSPLAEFHQESLKRAGISLDRMIDHACTADRIVAAITNRSQHFGSSPIIAENYFFSRNLFQVDIQLAKKDKACRFYVARGKVQRRRLVNEAEVIQLLQKYGFEVVSMDGKTLGEQARLFAGAEAIVAPHGAALTNLLFANSGAKVVELFPQGFVNNCYYVLSNYAKADYFYVQGETIPQTHVDPHHFDMYIDIEKLEQICQQAGF